MHENHGQCLFICSVPLPVFLDLVDEYFIHCHNQPYSFFHEANFRQSLAEQRLPRYLLYAMMASAVRFSSNDFFEDKDEAAEVFAIKSWDCFVPSSIARRGVGDLNSVQAIALLAIYDLTGSLHYSISFLYAHFTDTCVSWSRPL